MHALPLLYGPLQDFSPRFSMLTKQEVLLRENTPKQATSSLHFWLFPIQKWKVVAIMLNKYDMYISTFFS